MMISKSKRPSIAVSRIFGGIGNQLFIYAALRRLTLKSDAELVIDNISGFEYDRNYKRHYQLDHFNITCRKASRIERLEPFSKVRRYIKRYINKFFPYEKRNYIYQEGSIFDPRFLQLKLTGKVYVEGYWQDEKYFKDIENIIRQDLRIKSPADKVNLSMAEDINKYTSVAIHVRFFNDPDTGKDLSINYYKRAIYKMENRIPNAHYYIFSDRPEDASRLIHLPSDRVTIVNHNYGDINAYADLWLMTLCNHFIIANSTFSWWGAWLSESAGKYIIAPDYKNEINNSSKSFNSIIPSGWNKC